MGLSSAAPAPEKRLQRIADSGPLTVVVEKTTSSGVHARIVTASPHGAVGTVVRLRGQDARSSERLRAIVIGEGDGDDRVHPTTAGDPIVFAKASVEDVEGEKVAFVGPEVARAHSGMKGNVQVLKGLAKPTRFSVSKRGMTQYVSFTEPGMATRIADAGALAAFHSRFASAPWPGGEFRTMLREGRQTLEVSPALVGSRRETVEEFASRIAGDGAFSKGPLEALPVWSLPIGQEVQFREGDPRKATDGPSLGRLSRLYDTDEGLGWRRTFAVVHEEDEWAFGGATGRRIRVVGAYYPVEDDRPVVSARLRTRLDRGWSGDGAMRFFFPDEASMSAAVARRSEGRASEPRPQGLGGAMSR